MSFQQSAETLRARLHVGAKAPLIAGVLAVAALVLAVAAFSWLQGEGSAFSIEQADASGTAASANDSSNGASQNSSGQDDAAAAAAEEEVCVHVSGAVVAPGVYRLPSGARVGDAVEAAGGFSGDAATDALNLARLLVDGEQVDVPTLEEAQQSAAIQGAATGTDAGANSTASGSTSSGKVNINTADATELDTLPGIGPALAQRIIDYRESNGSFSSVEDLKQVSGIGDKKFEQLSDLVCVG